MLETAFLWALKLVWKMCSNHSLTYGSHRLLLSTVCTRGWHRRDTLGRGHAREGTPTKARPWRRPPWASGQGAGPSMRVSGKHYEKCRVWTLASWVLCMLHSNAVGAASGLLRHLAIACLDCKRKYSSGHLVSLKRDRKEKEMLTQNTDLSSQGD